jgi:alkaline phosphatase
MNSESQVGWSRRDLLKLGGLATAGLSTTGISSCSPRSAKPKNIIFLISDGMSAGVPALAEAFSQNVRSKGTFWHHLATGSEAVHGQFDMASMASLVTDSAAASSAWASGQRVLNGAINQYPDGTELKPLGKCLQEQGHSIGLVTTSRITHATPAGFWAHVPDRSQEDIIAEQYLNQGSPSPLVLLGGGSRHFDVDKRIDKRDLWQEFRGKGHRTVRSRDELLQVSSGPVLGLFGADHLPYSLDQRQDAELSQNVPTLSEMTGQALSILSNSGKPFFLMVEGARVDHAAHANDAAGLLWDQLAFDDALGVALEFQKRTPDTLIIIGSDHGNANPGLNGMGASYQESTACFERLSLFRQSFTWIKSQIKKVEEAGQKPDLALIGTKIKEACGFTLPPSDLQALRNVYLARPVMDFSNQQKNFYAVLGQIMGNLTGVGWTGVTHTSDWTLRLAKGPGQERFSGLMKNTEFFDRVLELSGISFHNPAYTGEIPRVVLPPVSSADPTA